MVYLTEKCINIPFTFSNLHDNLFNKRTFTQMYIHLVWQFQTAPQPPTSEKLKKIRSLPLCNRNLLWTGAHRCGLATQLARLFFHLLKKKKKKNKNPIHPRESTFRKKVMINPSGRKKLKGFFWNFKSFNLLIQINSSEQGVTISPEED